MLWKKHEFGRWLMTDISAMARLSVWRAFLQGARLMWEQRLDVVRLAGPLFVLVLFVEQLGLAATVASDSDKAVFWDHLIDAMKSIFVLFLCIIADYHLYRSALGAKAGSEIDIDWPILGRYSVAYLKTLGLFFLGLFGFLLLGIVAIGVYFEGFGRDVFEHALFGTYWTIALIWAAILFTRSTFYFPDIAMGRCVKLRTAWRETWNLPVSFCIGLFAFYMITLCLPISVYEPFTDTGYQSRLWLLGRSIFDFIVYVLIIFTVSVLYQQRRALQSDSVEP